MTAQPYWATPRDEWPTRAELAADEANQPPIRPATPTERADLVAELVALQQGADQ